MGRVIAIPKAGKDPRLATSQRPITLLSHIAKLFERIALRRLLRHLTPRQEQFGFRSGHSTTLQLARVLHHMAAEHNRGRRTVGVFLDIERRSTECGTPDVVLALYADDSAYFASSRRADLAAAKSRGPRPIARMAGQMASRRKRYGGRHTDGVPPKLRLGDRMLNGRQRCDTWVYKLIAPCAWLKWNKLSTRAEPRGAMLRSPAAQVNSPYTRATAFPVNICGSMVRTLLHITEEGIQAQQTSPYG
ncbi:Probable RNA-directed DNA polymerase from transposon X-element [Eumeta japonica]|uniref:Probable RNA-directed DNA polymerase from transposon X-element n=1 Tax=Eumeta variegata TaxID=151549 RepID=A0A4C1ZU25_EUMVA|nr:Probable RNA-directed DNA polymerase from transposon X-element [Eumeta japonica]